MARSARLEGVRGKKVDSYLLGPPEGRPKVYRYRLALVRFKGVRGDGVFASLDVGLVFLSPRGVRGGFFFFRQCISGFLISSLL